MFWAKIGYFCLYFSSILQLIKDAIYTSTLRCSNEIYDDFMGFDGIHESSEGSGETPLYHVWTGKG